MKGGRSIKAMLVKKTIADIKLNLNATQRAYIDRWMDELKAVWNFGLELLMEYQLNKYYDELEKITGKPVKRVKRRLAKKPQFIDSLKNEKGKSLPNPLYTPKYLTGKQKVKIQIAREKRQKAGHSYPVHIPIQRRLKSDNYFGLCGCITKEKCPELCKDIPMAFVRGVLKKLADSWKAYTKLDKKNLDRKLPRFKRKEDKIKSLYSEISDCAVRKGDKISIGSCGKTLGDLKIVNNTLDIRWGDRKASTVSIIKYPSGYYLSLFGEFEVDDLPDSDKAIGIDVGLEYIISTSDGQQIDPPKYYRKRQKRLARLQRKTARQYKAGENKDGKNLAKTRAKVAKTHEKIARQRKGFNHALSTDIARNHGAVAVEDLNLKNLMRRPKPKKREDGKGYERNNAKAKGGLNKSFADAGLGQLTGFLETKMKAPNREFIKVQPAYTSQDCPRCGNRVKKSLSTRTHKCLECGCTLPRDVAAAINILGKADFVRSYPACTGEVKPLKDFDKESAQEELLNKSSRLLLGEETLETLLVLTSEPVTPKKKTRKRSIHSQPAQTVNVGYTQLTLWETG